MPSKKKSKGFKVPGGRPAPVSVKPSCNNSSASLPTPMVGTPDYVFLMLVVLLTCVGVIMVFSSSGVFSYRNNKDVTYFLKKEIIWLAISIVGMMFMTVLDYRYFNKIAKTILAVAVVLLLVVHVPGIGVKVNGARRWIGYGSFRFHVGEVAKLATIIYFGVLLTVAGKKVQEFKVFCTMMAVFGAMAFLILLGPDFGMAAMIGAVCLGMMYIAGARHRHIIGVFGVGVVGAVGLIAMEPYRMKRIMAFIDPFMDPQGKGFQPIQSMIALVNGGYFGRGLGDSLQKRFFLPEQHTDFIFAITAEEFGILGVAIIVCLFICLTFRGMQIARKCEDPLGRFLVFGIVLMISIQAFINMAVTMGMLPITGLTLPFISFGGSSLLVTYLGVGIALNVSMHVSLKKRSLNGDAYTGSRWNGRPHIPGGGPGKASPEKNSGNDNLRGGETGRPGGKDRENVRV